MKKTAILLSFLSCFLLAVSVNAQDSYPVITPENIRNLHSVTHIEFADWQSQGGKIDNGWFALSRAGDRLALMNRSGEVVVADIAGHVIDRYSVPGSDGLPAVVLDIAFREDEPQVVSVHAEGGAYFVAYRDYEHHQTEYYRFVTADVPLRIWDSGHVWLEVSPADYLRSRYVQALFPPVSNSPHTNAILPDDSVKEFDSGPENDPDSFLRIGRIEPPFAITITQTYQVKLWNLETDAVLTTTQLDAMPGAGQLSTDGRYFAWRDGDSKLLHVLDFHDGQDRVIAPLQGSYIPFLLLNSNASVIIGVNVALRPIVQAWDTATGEQIELGEYRSCSRQPDMVRLGYDGTMLVIGCDKGLDIWRVIP